MKAVEEFFHLIDHLGFIRPVDVMVGIGDTHNSGAWNAPAECFGLRCASRRVGGKARCSALRVVGKDGVPIVRTSEDREYWNGDRCIPLHTEVKCGSVWGLGHSQNAMIL